MITFNTQGKGVPFIEQRALTVHEMSVILSSDKFTQTEKEQIKKVKASIKKMVNEMGIAESRCIPMIDSNSKTFVWFD